MNIQTASGYARHGYRIFRPEWVDASYPNVVARAIYVVTEQDGSSSFMSDEGHYAILTVEDCLADDWQIITQEYTCQPCGLTCVTSECLRCGNEIKAN